MSAKPYWKGGHRKAARETRAELNRRFPAAFAPMRGDKRPLKIGIDKDLFAACPDIQPFDITLALQDYTGGRRYLRACVAGATRIGLDGADAGLVTEAQAEHARRLLHRIEQTTAERKAAA